MDTFTFDSDCGIEDAENKTNRILDKLDNGCGLYLGLVEDQDTGLLSYDEETEYGYITYV